MIRNRLIKHVGLLALVALALVWATAAQSAAYESRSNRAARVSVNVTPTELAPGKPAKFQVRMNTHSVTLSQDLQKVSTLTDNLGNHYQPTAWKGSPPGGHHVQGLLLFPPLNPRANSVELVIRGVSKVPKRVFGWKIEK